LNTLKTVQIRVLDKEYQVQCQPEEMEALLESARALDQRMQEIRKTGNVIGLERTAVMAALNLSHDLLRAEQNIVSDVASQKDLERMDSKLVEAIQQLEKHSLNP
jgi:cell division protein ZapA